MLEHAFQDVVGRRATLEERPEGVAFLKAALDLYHLSRMTYLALNIPNSRSGRHFVHALYSDRSVRHCVTSTPVETPRSSWHVAGGAGAVSLSGDTIAANGRAWTTALRTTLGEKAYVAASFADDDSALADERAFRMRELEVLGNYFHSHVLRMNGNKADDSLLVTARELDCLRWTAAGKTAWEASVILGISERTVRFHLNSAREKLNCATTAQAIAHAVANGLIAV